MERLQDQTRSEESGQGVIIIQSRALTTRDPRDSPARFRVGGAERNSTFADTWTWSGGSGKTFLTQAPPHHMGSTCVIVLPILELTKVLLYWNIDQQWVY